MNVFKIEKYFVDYSHNPKKSPTIKTSHQNNSADHYDIAIAGGGLAGLLSAIALKKRGYHVALLERNEYPFHKVCGEYISTEVIPYLQSLDCYPQHLDPAHIHTFVLSDISGKVGRVQLNQGGFGISRFALDAWLAEKATALGVHLRTRTRVEKIDFDGDTFTFMLPAGEIITSKIAIGAYGKRSRLDKQLDRDFIKDSAPYVGVKYHIKTEFPADVIALHNFPRGYCGISKVEGDAYNLCYLASRDDLRKAGNIQEIEETTLHQNPHLKRIWEESDFLFEQPKVINEVSFAPKAPVENHLLMCGDTAGLITPLCGNGMAMAIHASKLCTEAIAQHMSPGGKPDRAAIEQQYARNWRRHFAHRLWVGRTAQKAFGYPISSKALVGLVRLLPPVAKMIIKQTHGRPF